jgi:transglutaminase-like putative cysteine protease
LALLLLAFGSLIFGVAGAVRGLERSLLWPIVGIGLLLGWLLARSRYPGWLAAVLSLMGLLPALVRVGRLAGPLANLAQALARVAWQTIRSGRMTDRTALLAALTELGEGVTALTTRLTTWALALARGEPIFDPVVIALVWGMALWGAAVWASWAVRRRRQPVLAVLPAVLLLALMLAYVGGGAFYLLPMLVSMLVLNTMVTHQTRQRRWQQTGVTYSARAGRDVVIATLGMSLALAVVSLLTPSISVYGIVEYVQERLAESASERNVVRSLGLEPQPDAAQEDVFAGKRDPGLPSRHLIGSGPELAEQVVMVVEIEEDQGEDEASRPRYWHSLSYGHYTGRGWSVMGTATVPYDAGEPARSPEAPNRTLLRQRVRLVEPAGGLVYVTGSLVTVDQDYRVAWRARGRETGTYFDAFGALLAEAETAVYRADSLLPSYSEAELRTTGSDYPDWIARQYLALPDSVPERVLALAQDLTATGRTPYDRALAIERYLRTFPYTLDLPAPPRDRDVADYFLFDLQKGYCDYYATSMVVLARAAGLPARMVTGYIGGQYDEANDRYTVTADLAHAWPQVYFPGYGWIPFEPTGGRPAIEREAESPHPPAAKRPLQPITADRNRINWGMWLAGAGGSMLLVVLGGMAWPVVDGWRLRHLSPDTAVIQLYQSLYGHGRRLHVLPRPNDTPYEYTGRLASRLRHLARQRRGGTFLASLPQEIDWLTELYIRAQFSPRPPAAWERDRAVKQWLRLRGQLLWARLLTINSSANHRKNPA